MQSSGTYSLAIRFASIVTGAAHIQDENGTNLTGAISFPNTNGFQAWQTYTTTIPLTAGPHILEFVVDSGGNYNLDVMTFAGPQ